MRAGSGPPAPQLHARDEDQATIHHPRYEGPVIDAHCHYDTTTIDSATRVLDQAGLTAAIHLWDAAWPPATYESETASWGRHDPRLLRCHVPDFSRVGEPGNDRELDRALRRAAKAGAVGVKVWKNLGLWLRDHAGRRLAVDDPRIESVWAAASDAGLPVVIHQGDTPAFWAPLDESNHRLDELRLHPDFWYGGGDFPPLAQLHEELETVVATHHATTFVGLHFGCFMEWPEVARMLSEYSNYHVDTATAVADMGRAEARDVVRALLLRYPDRVIFGTDLVRTAQFDIPAVGRDERWDVREWFERHWWFFETAEDGLQHPLTIQGDWTVKGLDLPDQVLTQLYFENAMRTFGLDRDRTSRANAVPRRAQTHAAKGAPPS